MNISTIPAKRQDRRMVHLSDDDIARIIDGYGPLVTDSARLSFLEGPVLGIFAKQDTSITPAKVQAFEQAMKQADKAVEIRMYDANHAFANPSGKAYNSEAVKDAWEVTKAFLDRHLGK